MNIGLDLDGTITRCPAFFSTLSKAFMAAGHRVYVVTWREDREFALEDLAEHGVAFDELILPDDDQIHGVAYEDGKAAAARWKAEVCRTRAIDVLFEDMPEVARAIDPQTAVFLTVAPDAGNVTVPRAPRAV